jgi:methylmalonyl-CoA mutase cobalamin-binding domain/chain
MTPQTMRLRKSVVVSVGRPPASDRGARALASSLRSAGVDIVYLGREACASRIARCAADANADAVEVCLVPGTGGVGLLRELLRELRSIDRSGVSIVVHRVQ